MLCMLIIFYKDWICDFNMILCYYEAIVAIVPPPLVALIEYCLNQMHASDVRIDSKGTA